VDPGFDREARPRKRVAEELDDRRIHVDHDETEQRRGPSEPFDDELHGQ
jgi:hypothetical protein